MDPTQILATNAIPPGEPTADAKPRDPAFCPQNRDRILADAMRLAIRRTFKQAA